MHVDFFPPLHVVMLNNFLGFLMIVNYGVKVIYGIFITPN